MKVSAIVSDYDGDYFYVRVFRDGKKCENEYRKLVTEQVQEQYDDIDPSNFDEIANRYEDMWISGHKRHYAVHHGIELE